MRLLDALSIPYTMDFAEELYFTHPNRDNMLGLCQMCEVYGIAAKGVKVFSKNIDSLSIPSVLLVNGQFVVLTDLTDEEVAFDRNGQAISQNKCDFINLWDGEALLIESTKGAIEPSFMKHRKQERRKKNQSLLLSCSLFLCGGIMLFQVLCQRILLSRIFVLIDILGILFSYLLLQKQTFRTNEIGDKICSMFHQNNCTNLIFSEKAKIYGYSWSEVGMGYFVAHFLMTSMCSSAIPILSVIGWCAMFYGLWSVYYQSCIAKQWCVLCVCVQILLWVNGVASIALQNDLFFVARAVSWYCVSDGIIFLAITVVITVIVHQIVKSIKQEKSIRDMTYQYNVLKCNNGVFRHILHQRDFIPTCLADSMIVFGNEKSQCRITILTNPHCNPCAVMHKQVEELLVRYGDRLSVQYIFLAFNENLKKSNRFLIAVFQQLGKVKALEIYRKWYELGKYQAETFMAQYSDVHCDTFSVEQELQHQISWISRFGMTTTPTILVNSYVLPPEYNLGDLPLLADVLS